MNQFIETLQLKYNIRREYFTILIPVIIALCIVLGAYFTGFAVLPGQEGRSGKTDREKAYEELVKQIAEESGEDTGSSVPVTKPPEPAGKPVLNQVIVIATIVAITPYAIDITLDKRRTRRKEELYTEFLFKLSELMRGGLDPVKSMIELSRTDLGELTPHVRMAATAMTYGKSFEEAMKAMTKTLYSELITRYTVLVVQASYSGGSVSDLILKASEDMRSIIGIEREKEGNLSQYVMIFYFAQGIIFFIALTLTSSLLPFLQDISTSTIFGANEVADIDFIQGFFSLIMINAFFGGLIIGKIAEGEARFGLKHTAILMAAGYIACVFLLFPAGEAPPAGDVQIKILSGGGQEGIIGLRLLEPIVVEVTDLEGKPIARADVQFTIVPGGTVKPATTKTGSDGRAGVQVILGQDPGTYIVSATSEQVTASVQVSAITGG